MTTRSTSPSATTPRRADGPGHLYAIDATKTGDITETGKLWHVGGEEFGRTISNVTIADGLLYAIELAGYVSCYDARTGQRHWRHDIMASVWGSALVVDSKVILGTTDGEILLFGHGKTARQLATIDMHHTIYTTPSVANRTLYITTNRHLYAIKKPAAKPTASTQRNPDQWPMFRGVPQLTGVANTTLPDQLDVRWKYDTGEGVVSTAAIVDGLVYVPSDEGTLYALNLADGTLKWKYATGEIVESSPTVVESLVIFGDDLGIIHACDAKTGTLRWRYETGGRIVSSANSTDGRIIVGSYDGTLYCLQAADGKLIWKYETEDRVHASPALAAGHVMVGGCDGHLHVVKRQRRQARSQHPA